MKAITERYDRYNNYLPHDFYKDKSEEEVFAALTKQAESLECHGYSLTLRMEDFAQSGRSNLCFNNICDDVITPYHNHNFYEINYVWDGTLVQYIDKRKYVLRKGDLILLAPAVHHTSFPVRGASAINVLLRESFVEHTEKELATYGPGSYLTYLLAHPAFILFRNTGTQEIDRLITEIQNIGKNSQLAQYRELLYGCLGKQLLIRLSHCERSSFETARYGSLDAAARAGAILQYVNENYATDSLGDVARRFSYSSKQIHRIIQKSTGYSYAVYVQFCRMAQAKLLLSTTELSVAEITALVGLGSPAYFSRRFKYENGCTPSEYRKNHASPDTP